MEYNLTVMVKSLRFLRFAPLFLGAQLLSLLLSKPAGLDQTSLLFEHTYFYERRVPSPGTSAGEETSDSLGNTLLKSILEYSYPNM